MTSATRWQSDLDLIRDVAREAASVALGFFGASPEVWWKDGGASPVSAADFAANDVLMRRLREARPGYGWLSEETDDDDSRLDHDTLFVVDPIDGTRGFINGAKTWCVSVAVVHQGVPVAGVLAAPALEEEFYALDQGPSFRNGHMLDVAGASDAGRLNLATDEATLGRLDAGLRSHVDRAAHIPSLAYKIAMVAEGRLDGALVKRSSHDWDLAAADLILQGAGGSLVDLSGRPVVYNRETVSHEILVAGSAHALTRLSPHLTSLTMG